jgi:glycine hydroxymethyltransferase
MPARPPRWGGGQAAARRLEAARLLSCGIGLPHLAVPPVAGDVNGLRLGVPEIVRLGLGPGEMDELASLIARGLRSDADARAAASDVTALRRRFSGLRFVRP